MSVKTPLILGLTLGVLIAHAFFVSADTKRSRSDKDAGEWYSLDTEKQVGQQESVAIEQHVTLLRDAAVLDYVTRLAEKVARNSDAQFPIAIRVIDTDDVEAITLPGGYQYISRGLLLRLENEGELASILARGIAHTALRSATRLLTRQNLAQIGSVPLIVIGGNTGPYPSQSLEIPLTLLKFRRDFELEADYLGIQYVYKSGYEPQCFIHAVERVWPSSLPSKPTAKAFSPFPPTPDRVKALRKEIEKMLAKKDGAIVSTPGFDVWNRQLKELKPQESAPKPLAE